MENKIKVCHVISGYYRNDPRIFQRQCKSLVNGGFEVCILTNDGQPNEVMEGIKLYATDKYWKNRIKVLLFANSQFIKKAIEINADIYQLHSPELLSLGLTLKKLGKIVIFDSHEDLPSHILEKEWIPLIVRKPISIFINFYMNRVLKNYNEIISPHQHVVEKLELINANTTLITNFAKVGSLINYDLSHYLNRENIICYSGTVYSSSNQEFILEAISNINNLKYQIAGFIDENYQEQLSERKGFKKLKFLGRIPYEELGDFYSKSLIGIVIMNYTLNL